ncbi:hypothetical protein FH972_023667 [Carpinus fangiana]|uniref:Uncharacterized protein n=1 Tax=Carpinus fangiana TaxID=176857 RepID=A0A5N6KWC2_9ROSI|nr:hypothetical protein FH972_023667 [Carpinus fangiana]
MDFPTPGSSESPSHPSSETTDFLAGSIEENRHLHGTAHVPTSGINQRDPYVMAPVLRPTSSTDPSSTGLTDYTSRSSSSQPLSATSTRGQSQTGIPSDTGPEHIRSVVQFNQGVLDAQAYTGDPVPIDGQLDTHVSIILAVYGWHEARQKINLDRRWLDFGTAVEQFLSPMDWAARIAIILLGRWTLKYYGDYGPFHEPEKPSLPTFLRPRPSQLALRHPPWVDYIPWPGFRERFTFEPARYCTNECFSMYMANYRFSWQRPAHDTIVKDTRTGLLRLTEEFLTALKSIDSHRMAGPFFAEYPELAGDAQRVGARDGLSGGGSVIGGFGGRRAGRESGLKDLVDAIRLGHPAEGSIKLRRQSEDDDPEDTAGAEAGDVVMSHGSSD